MARGRSTYHHDDIGDSDQEVVNKELSLCCPTRARSIKPSTLIHQPSTLNPQPSTLNPQPSTLNPQPSTLNAQP